MLLYFAIAIPFILFLRLSHQKIEHLKIRKGKNKIKAKLVKYKTEKETISKNNHTHTNYDLTAYVTLQTNDNEKLVCPLNYQKIYPFYKPFDIGEEI